MNFRLEKVKNALICPDCGSELVFLDAGCDCKTCKKSFPIKNGKIYFIDVLAHNDTGDLVKEFFRKIMGRYYYTIGVGVLSPIYPFRFLKQVEKRLDFNRDIIVDAGCGNYRLNENFICIDCFDYDAVDIVCDLRVLPFKNSSIDAFLSQGVLEHVSDPVSAVNEFYRCTRENGWGIHDIAFMYPFHAAPDDYQRYTHIGINKLFEKYQIEQQAASSGPASLLLVCIIEFLSTIFSFGLQSLKAHLYLILCAVLFPFKFIDVFFVGGKRFMNMAPSLFFVVKKT